MSGCYAIPTTEGLQPVKAEQDAGQILIQNLTPSDEPVRQAAEPFCPQPILLASVRPVEIYQPTEPARPSYEPAEVERSDINLEDALKLDLTPRLDLSTIRPTFQRGFNLDDVTINLHGNERQFTITDDLDNLYNPYFDPYGMRRDQEYQQNSGKLGAREYRMILQSAREIVRRLAQDGYRPFIYINRGLIYIERAGGLLQDVYGGIESLWTIDLGNLEQDFTDPLAPLRQALRVEQAPQREESRVQFTGRIEPTLNGKRIGTGSGQDILGLLQGEKEADLGFQFRIEIRW